MAKKPPRWYFSLRSPYSWLAYRDLLARYPDVADTLVWEPFWEPDERSSRLLTESGGQFPYVPMSREKHRYILQDVRRLAADRGLPFTWPVDVDPVWEVPHLAYFLAEDAGRGREYVALAYRARWEEGRNICDRAVVADLAGRLDLDADRAAHASDDDELRARGLAALRAIDRDGVFGVPFFAIGYDKFWGLERLPGFVAAVRGTLPAESLPVDPEDVTRGVALLAASDHGHAGGCG
jgi:2-hydroxychromene-2-carboxylate isomerase